MAVLQPYLTGSYRFMEKRPRPFDLLSEIERSITQMPENRRRLDQPEKHNGSGIRVQVGSDTSVRNALGLPFGPDALSIVTSIYAFLTSEQTILLMNRIFPQSHTAKLVRRSGENRMDSPYPLIPSSFSQEWLSAAYKPFCALWEKDPKPARTHPCCPLERGHSRAPLVPEAGYRMMRMMILTPLPSGDMF